MFASGKAVRIKYLLFLKPYCCSLGLYGSDEVIIPLGRDASELQLYQNHIIPRKNEVSTEIMNSKTIIDLARIIGFNVLVI